jgi:hypothetical protein
MSPDVGHCHSFLCEDAPGDFSGLCECGLSFAEFLRLNPGAAIRLAHTGETTGAVDGHARAFNPPAQITNSVIIDWGSKNLTGGVISALVVLTDAETGQPILTATELHVHGLVGHSVVAELVTLADADGNPILDGNINGRVAFADDGTIATATSWWHVAEMRVS